MHLVKSASLTEVAALAGLFLERHDSRTVFCRDAPFDREHMSGDSVQYQSGLPTPDTPTPGTMHP